MTIPYVYIIGWKKLDTWYIGCRHANGCHPSDLWKDYFTSSDYVKAFREINGDPDSFEIVKEFDNEENALLFEQQKQRELGVLKKSNWLNRCIGGVKFRGGPRSAEAKRKMSEKAKARRLGPLSEKHKLSISIAVSKSNSSIEVREKLSKANKGKVRSFEQRERIANGHKGRKLSEETKRKIAEKARGRKHSEEHKRKISEGLIKAHNS